VTRAGWEATYELVAEAVQALDPDLSPAVIVEVLDESFSARALSVLASSLEAEPAALVSGAPPVIGRLVEALGIEVRSFPNQPARSVGEVGSPLSRPGSVGSASAVAPVSSPPPAPAARR
jgi:hypothetical protein